MDYKLRKTVILWVLALSGLLILGVLWMNREPEDSVRGERQDSTRPPLAEKQDGTAAGEQGKDLSAFLQDETFFDEEKNSFLEQYLSGEVLTLKTVSVCGDLRISILGEDGKPVQGEDFLLKFDEEQLMQDSDRDGIVYLEEVTPGTHQIRLMTMEGYQVPPAAVQVMVKEKPEYLKVEDIEFLIYGADEVNGALEDTGFNEAQNDSEKNEIKRRLTTDVNSRLGIDVSEHDGEIDWDKVKAAGIDFAILRAGYRGSVTGVLVEDAGFRDNLYGARAAGLDIGISFFSQAITEAEAIEEASVVLHLLGDRIPEYPVYLISQGAGEQSRAIGLEKEDRTRVVQAFCRTIVNGGLQAGVYASRTWCEQKLNMSDLEAYSVWVGEHRKSPLYQGYYQMWQYTDECKVDGIKEPVNANMFYKK